jgi:hypothetical protein
MELYPRVARSEGLEPPASPPPRPGPTGRCPACRRPAPAPALLRHAAMQSHPRPPSTAPHGRRSRARRPHQTGPRPAPDRRSSHRRCAHTASQASPCRRVWIPRMRARKKVTPSPTRDRAETTAANPACKGGGRALTTCGCPGQALCRYPASDRESPHATVPTGTRRAQPRVSRVLPPDHLLRRSGQVVHSRLPVVVTSVSIP